MVPRQLLFFLGLLPCLVLAAVDSNNNDIETAAETREVLVSAEEGLAVGAANVQAFMKNETTASQATPWSAVDMTEEMYFGVDIGVPQVLYDQVEGIEQQQVESIARARTYLQQEIWVNGPNVCSNRVEYCAYYAITGECEKSADFMQTKCAPMCRMCDPNAGHVDPLQMGYFPSPVALQHQDPNCPVDFSTNTWGPGDLDKMFERILSTPEYQNYEPKVMSRPSLTPGDTNETADYIVGSPWMIVFDNFVTKQEADRLVELGAMEGYDRSLDVSNLNSDGSIVPGASPDRTSTNAWCAYIIDGDFVAAALCSILSQSILSLCDLFQALMHAPETPRRLPWQIVLRKSRVFLKAMPSPCSC